MLSLILNQSLLKNLILIHEVKLIGFLSNVMFFRQNSFN